MPGQYGSPESLEAYNKEMALILTERVEEKTEQKKPRKRTDKITVLEMVADFLVWGETYYVRNGEPTGTLNDFVLASKPLVEKYGELQVEKFVQMDLIEIQDYLVKLGISRDHLNKRIGRIKRIFNWAAGRGLISHDVAGRLKFVENLKEGRTTAPDLPPRQPVPDNVVDATLPHLPPVVADMVRLQRLTGMRPGEIFSMTWSQIDTSDDIWVYMPSHKTEHHDIDAWVPLNKSCQAILERYKDTPKNAIIFSQKRTMRERSEREASQRKTKRQPSQVERYNNKQTRCEHTVKEEYDRGTYRKRVQAGVAKYNKIETKAAKEENREPVLLPKWFSYQIRHRAGTNVYRAQGKDAAQALLGHTRATTTDVYIHEEIERRKEIARRMDEISGNGTSGTIK